MRKNQDKKEKTTALVPYREQLAAMARRAEQVEKVKGGLPTIEIKAANLLIDEQPVEGNELEVVVVASVFANTLYADKFQPGVVSLPVCYAFGDPDSDDPEGTMRPHEEAEDPQSDACADCPMNQFGSAPEGRGKACKNTRRLAVMLAEDLDNIEEAEVRRLTLSPTNLKGWAAYVNMVAKTYGLPPQGVVTRIKCVPDLKNQYKLLFSVVEEIDFGKVSFESLMRRKKEAESAMTAPYPKPEDVQEEPTRRAVKSASAKAAPRAPRAAQTVASRTAARTGRRTKF